MTRLNDFSGNGNRYNLSIVPDYSNKTVHASLVFSDNAQGLQSGDLVGFALLNKKGHLVSRNAFFNTDDVESDYGQPYQLTEYSSYTATAQMGLNSVGYNPNITSNSLTVDHYFLQTDVNDNLYLYSTDASTSIPLPYRSNLPRGTGYTDIPVTINRGDHVIYGTISAVENKNKVTLNLSTENRQAISGNGTYYVDGLFMQRNTSDVEKPASGLYTVISQGLNSGVVWVDGDVTSWSGAYVKIKPRSTISSYSGWTDPSNVESRITLSSTFATGIGEWTSEIRGYTYQKLDTGTYLGLPASTAYTPTLLLTIADDDYKRSVKIGDRYTYEDSLNPGTYITVPVYKASISTLDLDGSPSEWAINVLSGNAPVVGRSGTVTPYTDIDIDNYPQFGEDVTAVLFGSASGESPTFQALQAQVVRMPTAQVDFVANEYDSSFGTLVDKAHFHFGPVHLSDGTVLRNDTMRMVAKLYSADPSTDTALKSWDFRGTRDYSASEYYDGSYVKNGVFVGTYNGVFDSSSVLTLSGTFSIGSAKLEKIYTIPVQPNS